MDVDVAYASGTLRAADDASGTAQGHAVAYLYVLRWPPYAHALGVAPALHGEAVVLTVERAVLNEHVACRLDVDAVSASVAEAVDGDTTDDDAVAILRHHVPVKALVDGDALDEHVLAVDGGDGLGEEDGAF